MSTQSEAALENNLIKDLVANGYQRVILKDEKDLYSNFKIQLEKHNELKLKEHGISSFSDNEFNKICNHLIGSTIFNNAKIIREQPGWSFKLDNGDNFYVNFLNTSKWCQNIFQVANQINMEDKYKVRYDVTILINGFPLVQIELKKRGIELKEAFNQICRYHKSGTYKNLFSFIQLFVVSNGVETKYFANNKELNYKQTFYWTDVKNKKYSLLADFTKEFLEKCHIAKMISKYMVLHETSRSLMVLRPYQYYAVEKIIESVENKAMKNGFIWHTTGSGKTLTSFKASQILATNPEIDKVVFCVDRKDLDFNTMKEFNNFSPKSVDSTENSKNLLEKLIDQKSSIIITTLQKLNNVVSKEHYLKQIEKAKDKRIVFIFDECHRSQFGDSHKKINEFFTNKQFFGFTGTPIFNVNANKNRTTKMLFGDCLHSYIIKNAIADDNVLAFSVEYLNTFKDPMLIDSESGRDKEYDELIEGIDKKEVFNADRRINLVVDHILKIHNTKTKNKEFTAMFAVSSVPALIKYYDAFKSKKHDLKVATIFSYKANDDITDDGTFYVEDYHDKNIHPKEKFDEFINDYNKMFQENFDINKNNGFNAYYVDVSKKVKERKIDILLVVNMFLTGFDSKYLNTLYTDKNLRYHGLIQAYSRTNRILNEQKKFGQIVNFRNIYKNTNEAVELYSNDEDILDIVLMKSYNEYLKETNNKIQELLDFVENPESVDNIESESDKLEFIKLFRNITRGINMLDTFIEFSYADLGINEQTYADFKSKYFSIYQNTKKNKESILKDIDFEIDLIRKDEINVDYILMLLSRLDKLKGSYAKELEFIEKQIDSSSNLHLKKDLILSFILSNNLRNEDEVKQEFIYYMEQKKSEELQAIIEENKLDATKFKKVLDNYEYTNKIQKDEIKKCFIEKLGFIERKNKADNIINIMQDHEERFLI